MKEKIASEIERLEKLFKNDLSKEQKKVILKDFSYRIEEIIEQPELKVGQWYKSKGGALYCPSKVENDRFNAYGFGWNGEWENDGLWCNSIDFEFQYANPVPATDKEVEEALIEEAKKRYKVGDICEFGMIKDHRKLKSNKFKVVHSEDGIRVVCHLADIVFRDGQWAEIVEQPEEKCAGEKMLYEDCVKFLNRQYVDLTVLHELSDNELSEVLSKITDEIVIRHHNKK